MDNILVGDIETDGLHPSRIWVVGVLDYNTNHFTSYTGDDIPEGLVRLAEADLCIGHNFIGYDVKHIERLTDGLVTFDRGKIVDTLQLGRKVVPGMDNYKLETWGEILGYPKIHFNRFDVFDPLMVPYCERDCEISAKIFRFLMEQMG